MSKIKEQLLSINKTSKKSVAMYHKFALSIGISDSALGILYALFELEKPCSQYDLCIEWFIPKQTINTAVNILQKKGYVYLLPVQGTKNKKNIALTDEGKEFVVKNIAKLHEAEINSFSTLTSLEREQYIYLNEKYNNSLSEQIKNILK